MEARRGSGRRRQRPQGGALPDGTERGCKQSQEGDAPGSRQGTEAPRVPHESSTVACTTPAPGHSPVRAAGKPSPRAADPAGCAVRRPCPASSASPQHRRDLKRPAVVGGHQGGSPARALAVDQRVPVPEPPLHQVRPLGVGPTEPDAAQPSSCPCRRGPPAPYPRPPPA